MRSIAGSKLAVADGRRKDMGRLATVALLACGAFAATAASADEDQGRFPLQFVVSSTIPSNGDLNPYGIVFVPKDSRGRQDRARRRTGLQLQQFQ